MPKLSKLSIELIIVLTYVSYELNNCCIYLIDCILTFLSNITIGLLSVHAHSVSK